MVNDHKVKQQFDEARQALIKQLFSPGATLNPDDVLVALNRMNHAFTRLLIDTMVDHAQLSDPERLSQMHEVVCVHAVNMRDDDEGSDWQILFINGQQVDRTQGALSVRDYTRQMVEAGWKTFSPPSSGGSIRAKTVRDQSIYELYFYRAQFHDSTTAH